MRLQCAVIYKDCPTSPTELEQPQEEKGLSVLHSLVPVFLCLLSSLLGLLAIPFYIFTRQQPCLSKLL